MSQRILTMALLVALTLLFAQAQEANAQAVPYKASGTDAEYYPGSGDYEGVGNGTHVGKHTIAGNVNPDGVFFPEPGVFFAGTFTGTQTVTAANGDTIAMDLSGDVILVFNDDGLVEGTWFPEFTITGGTGRLANASRTLFGTAVNPPFNPASQAWGFYWDISGTIDLGRKGKK